MPGRLSSLLGRYKTAGFESSAVGVTRSGTPIPCIWESGGPFYETPRTRLLLVAGLDGSDPAVEAAAKAFEWFTRSAPPAVRRNFTIAVVPVANPDGWLAGAAHNTSGGNPTRAFPPQGDAYLSPTDPEAAYLWRWIGMYAPDLVIILSGGTTPSVLAPATLASLAQILKAAPRPPEAGSLTAALPPGTPADVGSVPALELSAPPPNWFEALLSGLTLEPPSPARKEILARLNREPLDVARQLAAVYGHELPTAVYIPAVALIGRLYLDDVTNGHSALPDVESIAAPYVTGQKASLPEKPTSSHFSGHLIFGELYSRTGKKEYLDRVLAAAAFAFDPSGAPLEAMPFHNEMSDGVFMGGPILALAGYLTGDDKYFAASIRNSEFFDRLCRRPDGLYRHSPLDEAAWGRGNAFPALGMALTLTWLPFRHPGRQPLTGRFRALMSALANHQDATGAWHQVIDHPESYRELSSTSMIAFSMIRGVRNGWLAPGEYRPVIARAWRAIKTRVAADGRLVDVCTSTGKQKSLRDYFDRIAILGPDPRGGAMALLVSTEMARWEKMG